MTLANGKILARHASPTELGTWDDLVRRFPNYRLPHLRTWIDSLDSAGCGRPLYVVFEKHGKVVGLLPGLLSKVGPWKLFGSPLPGWQTVSMGPVFDPAETNTGELMGAAIPFLEDEYDVSYVELLHTGLDPVAMRALGFEGEPVATYRASLYPEAPARALKAMHDSARRNIKRAEKLGLRVQFEETDEFLGDHYEQLREVYLRRGTTIPFSQERLRHCFKHLKETGNLIAVSVLLPGSRIRIATGMFLLQAPELLLWMWAHRMRYRWYRPTELMTWAVMQKAMERGCTSLDFMGRGDFKAKLGAEPDLSKQRWTRSRKAWIREARRIAHFGFYLQQAVRGRAVRALLTANEYQSAAGRLQPAVVMGGVDLVRALGLGGIDSVVAAPPGTPQRFSRFTRATLDVEHLGEYPERIVDALVRYGLEQPQPPPLFYDTDGALLLISRNRDRLRSAFRFVVADAPLVEDLVDKSRFQKLAQRFRLPIPAAVVLRPSSQEAPRDLAVPFPLIVKPLIRQNEHWGPFGHGGKALQVDTPAQLRELWPRLAAANLPVLAQELVPGPETSIESYHVYANESGTIVGEFAGKKIRTHPLTFGDSTALEVTDAADVLELGRTIVRRLKLRGVAKLDMKRAPDGSLRLLEINPRFTLWHHLGACAGVNLAAMVYHDLVGLPQTQRGPARVGARWCKPWSDIKAARASGVSLLRWIPWALSSDALSAFAWDDPMPLFGAGLSTWMERVAHRNGNGNGHATRVFMPSPAPAKQPVHHPQS
jgi:D-aspartate ligase